MDSLGASALSRPHAQYPGNLPLDIVRINEDGGFILGLTIDRGPID